MRYTDEHGVWEVQGNIKMLIEPSEQYKQKQEIEQLEREALDSLTPSSKEVEQAEFEVRTLTLLMEVGLI
jgi:hypothetical protein